MVDRLRGDIAVSVDVAGVRLDVVGVPDELRRRIDLRILRPPVQRTSTRRRAPVARGPVGELYFRLCSHPAPSNIRCAVSTNSRSRSMSA